MIRTTLLAAHLALLIAAPAWAGEGWYTDRTDCTGPVDANPTLLPGKQASWCPSTSATLTEIVRVARVADCNWDGDTTGAGAGTVTLTVNQCSGSASATNDCSTTLFGGAAVTSNSESGHFSLPSGLYLLTASGTSADGRLLCTGRD